MALERLQKIIAKAGVASRREAEEFIRGGRVTVNGKVVTELGTRADALRDHVKVDGKLVQKAEQHRYLLIYKPREVMTTTSDPEGRPTILDLVRGVPERIFPVGRLDYHTEGLLLLTNDGDLAYRVSHPSSGSIKTYHVKVRGVPSLAVIDKLSRGVVLDGKRTLPCDIRPLRTTGRTDDEGNSWWEVQLREGRTNQIRRMFQYQGHPVSKLKRVAIGSLTDSKLGPGEWRELTDREIGRLLEEPAEPRAPRARRATGASRKAGARPSSRKSPRKAASRSSAPGRPSKSRPVPRAASSRVRSDDDRPSTARPRGKAAPARGNAKRTRETTEAESRSSRPRKTGAAPRRDESRPASGRGGAARSEGRKAPSRPRSGGASRGGGGRSSRS